MQQESVRLALSLSIDQAQYFIKFTTGGLSFHNHSVRWFILAHLTSARPWCLPNNWLADFDSRSIVHAQRLPLSFDVNNLHYWVYKFSELWTFWSYLIDNGVGRREKLSQQHRTHPRNGGDMNDQMEFHFQAPVQPKLRPGERAHVLPWIRVAYQAKRKGKNNLTPKSPGSYYILLFMNQDRPDITS